MATKRNRATGGAKWGDLEEGNSDDGFANSYVCGLWPASFDCISPTASSNNNNNNEPSPTSVMQSDLGSAAAKSTSRSRKSLQSDVDPVNVADSFLKKRSERSEPVSVRVFTGRGVRGVVLQVKGAIELLRIEARSRLGYAAATYLQGGRLLLLKRIDP